MHVGRRPFRGSWKETSRSRACVVSIQEALLSQQCISCWRSRLLSAGAFCERQMEVFLSHLTGLGSFIDHLGWKCWNISVFAHKWETERIPACVSRASFKVCLIEGKTFYFFFLNRCALDVPDVPLAVLKIPSTSLSRSTTWVHPSFQAKIWQLECAFTCVWWTETLIWRMLTPTVHHESPMAEWASHMLQSIACLASDSGPNAFKNGFGLAGKRLPMPPALHRGDGKCSPLKLPLKHEAAVWHDTSRLTSEFTKQMRSMRMMKEREKPTGTVLFTAIS